MYHSEGMPSSDETSDVLVRFFRRHVIANLDQLFDALGTRSRMTVFRRLSTAGYLSSYSHAGRYYTLRDIPRFDTDGLWQHAGVLFSRDGTLRSTVRRLVEEADAGQFHRELQLRVGLRVHNTLANLVEDKLLGREALQGEYLYVSADETRAAAQVERRTRMGASVAPPLQEELTPALVIEVLLEVIHGTVVRTDAQEVAARLEARRIKVTVAQVEKIFRRHGVVKKTAPSRSPRSRR
jgi:hypothetical protein